VPAPSLSGCRQRRWSHRSKRCARFRLAGAGITEFTPRSAAETADDVVTIQRILGALAA